MNWCGPIDPHQWVEGDDLQCQRSEVPSFGTFDTNGSSGCGL